MLNRSQQPHPRGDDRERINKARQAAEALFSPKRQSAGEPVSGSGEAAHQPARKPRVLGISSPAPASPPASPKPAGAPVRSERQTPPEIPRSQFARIRAWVNYGMTMAQVAEVYGVAVGEVERVLRQA